MNFTDNISAEHEGDDDNHEGNQYQVSEQSRSDTWPLTAAQAAGSAAMARSPHESLFSPGVPAMSPIASPDTGIGYALPHEGSPTPAGPSRPLSSLAAVASMTKCTSRLKLNNEHTPIVQLQTQIPSVQKSGDDPTTPLDAPRRKRTTRDLMGNEHNTLTTLSRLFADGTGMSNSRAPSYNQATGPLYLRGVLPACSTVRYVCACTKQHRTTQSPYQITCTLAVCSKDVILISASLRSASNTIYIVYSSTVPHSSPLLSLNPGLRVSLKR